MAILVLGLNCSTTLSGSLLIVLAISPSLNWDSLNVHTFQIICIQIWFKYLCHHCHVGATLGLVHFMCFNPIYCCLQVMWQPCVFFYHIYIIHIYQTHNISYLKKKCVQFTKVVWHRHKYTHPQITIILRKQCSYISKVGRGWGCFIWGLTFKMDHSSP